MPPAIQTLRSGLKIGLALLGRHGMARGSVAQMIHDGDTLALEAAGNLGVRMLGVDAPEVSFPLPGETAFRGIDGAEWTAFLDDPFATAPLEFLNALGHPLRKHLSNGRFGQGCAANHARHADHAHRALEGLVQHDMLELGQDAAGFRFFLAFAHEVMDGFGRLLCYANREQSAEPRPRSYNERLLELGAVSPYFIWPNVNPFRRQPSLEEAVPSAGDLSAILSDASLRAARDDVHAARLGRIGIFDGHEPLRLEPFELRFLARRETPSRWVVDLAEPGTDVLLRPTSYHEIPHAEDRLFVPSEYVPLWLEQGWRREA
jgi:hypothetical protein